MQAPQMSNTDFVMIFNPNAQKGKLKKKCFRELTQLMKGVGELIVTERIEDLDRVITGLREKEVDVLGLCGGDGTFSLTLSKYFSLVGTESLPRMLFLRGGTMNAILSHFNCRTAPKKTLRMLVEKKEQGDPWETVRVDMIRVNDHYGFTTGIMMPANLVAAYHEGGEVGLNKAIRVTARLIASAMVEGEFSQEMFSAKSVNLWIDGKEAPQDAFNVILASTINYVGLGFRPFHQAGKKPGYFHFLATDERPSRLVGKIGNLLRSEPLLGVNILDELAQSVRVKSPEPLNVLVDGEFFEAGTVEIAVGPQIEIILG